MTNIDDDHAVIQGSGNIFRDLGRADADVRQTKAALATRIIGVLDDRDLTIEAAAALTDVSESELS